MSASAPGRALRVLAWRAGLAPQALRMTSMLLAEPLELEYLDTVLDGHEVTLLDGLADPRDPVALAGRLGADLVLVSCCLTNLDHALDTARRLKALSRPPLVVFGGPHLEVRPEHAFDPAVDAVFHADALRGVRLLVDRIVARLPWEDIPGAAFPLEGTWRVNEGPPLDPATLPVPRRRLLEEGPERYNYMYHAPCATLKTSFGCPGRCGFCFCARMHQGRFAVRPISAVVDEIAGLRVESVFIVDDDLFAEPTRVLEMCRCLEERGIRRRYVAYASIRSLLRAEAALDAFARQGLDALILGLESIDDEELEAYRKGATASDNDRALALCRARGVEVFALFVVSPAWGHGRFFELLRYLWTRRIAFATFSTLQALPVESGGPCPSPTWRYDLLRLHERPARMRALTWYLWLFLLYVLPTFRFSTLRTLLRRYGFPGYLRLVLSAFHAGADFLFRLLRWP